MRLEGLTEARLLRRYKRFLADVEFPNGDVITVHCPNTGAMTGCDAPGSRVWLQASDNPRRKYRWTWVLAETTAGHLVWIYSARANALVAEALAAERISRLRGYREIRREHRVASGERIDFSLSGAAEDCLVEVKSVTLLGSEGGLFPDAVSQRATRHVDALMEARANGCRAVLLFACLHTGIRSVAPARNIDPVYGQRLDAASAAGVELMAWGAEISTTEISLSKPLPVRDIATP